MLQYSWHFHLDLKIIWLIVVAIVGGSIVAIMKMDNVLNRRRARRWLTRVQNGSIPLTDDTLRMYHQIATRKVNAFPGMNAVSFFLQQHPPDSPSYRVLYSSMYGV